MADDADHGAIEPHHVDTMNRMMRELDAAFNPDRAGDSREIGLVLLVFPYGRLGRCNYISNGADRQDIATMFEEQAKHFRSQA